MLFAGIVVIWKKAGSRPLTGLEYFESVGWEAMKQTLPLASLAVNTFQSLNVPTGVADCDCAPAGVASPATATEATSSVFSFIIVERTSSFLRPSRA